jgi:DNA-binding MarR family transcriptional regulator
LSDTQVNIRFTKNVCRILMALDIAGEHGLYMAQICQMFKLSSGTAFPILNKMERAGWVETKNSANPKNNEYRGVVLYKLTPGGRVSLETAKKISSGRA